MHEGSDPIEAVAHDLNNLLTAIVGNADLLIASLPEGQEHDDAAEIGAAGRAAAELVKQLPHHTHGHDDDGSEEIFEP